MNPNLTLQPATHNNLYENECHESLAAIFDAIAAQQQEDSTEYMPTPIIFVASQE